MVKSQYTIKNFLFHLLRGTIKSVPVAGGVIEQLLYGPLDDKARVREAEKLQQVLLKLQGKSKTLEEIARFVKENITLSKENAEKLDTMISASLAARQGNTDLVLPEISQAFIASVDRDPLSAYLADLYADLRLWRGLGLDRPVPIDEIYVSTSLSKGDLTWQKTLSDANVLFDLLRERSPNRNLLVEGPAGSGKSTLLKHWTLSLAERPLDSSNVYIPIFLPLSFVELTCSATDRWDLPLPDLVANRFPTSSGQSLQTLRIAIAQAIENGNVVILLDGADEISEKRRPQMKSWIDGVCRIASRSPIVLTSRPTYFVDGLGGFRRYYVCPFSRHQKKLFIMNWFESINQPERAEQMDKYMERPEMFLVQDDSVAGNPLFLTMMCIEFELTKKLSRTPGKLVDQFTKILLQDWDLEKSIPRIRGRKLDLKRRILERVASHFFEVNRITFSLGEILDCAESVLTTFHSYVEPEELIREIEKTSGLTVEDRYGDWQFSHLLFQEFFTARFRWRLQHGGHDQKTWLQKANFDERYENVMGFYAQLGE